MATVTGSPSEAGLVCGHWIMPMLRSGGRADKISNKLAGDIACLGGSMVEHQPRLLGSRVRFPAGAFAMFFRFCQSFTSNFPSPPPPFPSSFFPFLYLSLPLSLPSTFRLRFKISLFAFIPLMTTDPWDAFEKFHFEQLKSFSDGSCWGNYNHQGKIHTFTSSTLFYQNNMLLVNVWICLMSLRWDIYSKFWSKINFRVYHFKLVHQKEDLSKNNSWKFRELDHLKESYVEFSEGKCAAKSSKRSRKPRNGH